MRKVLLAVARALGGVAIACQSTMAISAIGTTSGEFEVGASGNARYSVPITVIPGIGGIEPKLSVQFDSQMGDGYMGPRFAISGLSQITRCGRTIAQDGAPAQIKFNTSDAYCLDGQRLTSSSYGAIGAEYRQEQESFSRAKSVGGSSGDPGYFEVNTKAGLRMLYGASTTTCSQTTASRKTNSGQSGKAYVWLLSRVEDTLGNWMEYCYSYDATSQETLPAAINYTGNLTSGSSTFAKVEFTYRNKAGSAGNPVGYFYGMRQSRGKTLSRISTWFSSDATATRTYTLQYQLKGISQREQLTSIQECAQSDCLPPTSFTWAADDEGFASPLTTSIANIGADATHLTGDWDADGASDMIAVLASSSGAKALVVKRNVPSPARIGEVISTGPSSTIVTYSKNLDSFSFDSDWAKVAGDFNGDGRTDIGLVRNGVYSGADEIAAYVYLADPAATFSSRIQTFIRYTAGSNVERPLSLKAEKLVADLDLDLKDDLLLVHSSKSSGAQVQTYRGVPSGILVPNPLQRLELTLPDDGYFPQIGDLNGDGLPDLVLLRGNETTVNYRIYTNLGAGIFSSTPIVGTLSTAARITSISLLDQNADGSLDIVVFCLPPVLAKSIDVFLGKGNGSFDTRRSTSVSADGWSAPRLLVNTDYNSDGLPDVVLNRGGSIDAFYGLPDGRFSVREGVASLPSGSLPYGLDITGDGKADIVNLKTGTSGSQVIVVAGGLGISNWLVRVVNGLGAKLSVEYAALTDSLVYERSRDCGGENPRTVCQAIYVTSAVSRTNPTYSDRRTKYKYKDGRVDYQGRGFLGFAKRVITDELTGSRSETTYSQSFPFIGMPTETAEYTGAGHLAAKTNITLSSRVTTSTTPTSVFAWASSATSRKYEVAPYASTIPYQSTVTATSYDEPQGAFFGNVTSVDMKAYEGEVGTGAEYSTLTVNQYENDGASWILGRLVRAEVTRTAPGVRSLTRTTSYAYDTYGLLRSEVIEPDSAEFKVATTYQRDVYGNIKRTDTVGGDGTARWTTADYDPLAPHFSRFSTRSCNALSQCSSSTFEGRTGTVLSARDINNLTTTFTYDGFGRQEQRIFNQAGIYILKRSSFALCTGGSTGVCGSKVGAFARIETDNTGRMTTLVFDQNEREINSLTNLQNLDVIESMTDYTAEGYVARASAPKRRGTSGAYWKKFTYDDIGRVLTESLPINDSTLSESIVRNEYQGLRTVSYDQDSRRSDTIVNAFGKPTLVVDKDGNSVASKYDAFENLVETVMSDGTTSAVDLTTRIEFDLRGRKTKLIDPDLGTWLYEYNSLGERVRERDAKFAWSTMTYDSLGRLKTREDSDGLTTWYYDRNASGGAAFIGATAEVVAPGYRQILSYNQAGAVKTEQTIIDGRLFTTSHTYDGFGRRVATVFPSGFEIQNRYTTSNGTASPDVVSVYSPSTDITYWRADGWDVWGKASQWHLGNGLDTFMYRDLATGQVDAITTGSANGTGVQYLSYGWDKLGQLTYRQDGRQGITESFEYDRLGRLVKSKICGTPLAISCGSPTENLSVEYDGRGNIRSKNSVNYAYNILSPHAANFIGGKLYTYDANGNTKTAGGRSYEWTSANQLEQVRENGEKVEFAYGPNRERVLQRFYTGVNLLSPGTLKRTTYYPTTGLEADVYSGGVDYRHMITTPEGVVAVQIWNSPLNRSANYLHRDHLGSIDTVTNESGAVLQRLSYDAFGAARSASWSGSGPTSVITSYGFTGGERVGNFALLHLNGRVYDLSIGRFISADPFIQDPDNTQSYNRYSYVFNNPLALTDPTGFFSLGRAFKSIGKFLRENWRTIAAIGVAIAIPYGGAWIAGMEFSVFATTGIGLASIAAGGFASGLIASGGDLQAGLIGAWTAVAFVGAGNMFGTTLSAGKVAVHGAIGGLSTAVQGGDFGVGFLTSGASVALTGSVDLPENAAVRTAAASVVGGTVSVIGGGKFANGAMTASFGYLFNDWLHGLLEARAGRFIHDGIYFKEMRESGATRGLFGNMRQWDGAVDLGVGNELYEIKPVSYQFGAKYLSASTQLGGYVNAAGGNFMRGLPGALQLSNSAVKTLTVTVPYPAYTDTYKVTYYYDRSNRMSGLLFYEKSLASRQWVTVNATAGAVSPIAASAVARSLLVP